MLFDVLLSRFKQGYQTMDYPDGEAPALPGRFAGMPVIEQDKCKGCSAPCVEACPTGAIKKTEKGVALDLGRCLFCRDCESLCLQGALRFTREYRLAAADRNSLLVEDGEASVSAAKNLSAEKLCGRSLNLRVVSAGGCGACEADTNVLNTLAWDLSRFGIHYVASPRHADGLIITGPITKNMVHALRETYNAVPSPKFVIAVGSCAVSGGIYRDSDQCLENRDDLFPIDLHIPGCPPHPLTILDGLLRFIGRVPDGENE